MDQDSPELQSDLGFVQTYLVVCGHMWYELEMEIWLHIGQRGCQGGYAQDEHHSCCQYWLGMRSYLW